VLDHISIPVSHLEASARWYAQALQPLGMTLLGSRPDSASFGIGHMPYLTLHRTAARPAAVHIAFTAANRAQVREFHAAAIAAGGVDNGAPGLRPEYHAHYFGAFALDPDGHNVEVVRHTAEDAAP
jgi:catechol 2,3-dioxygenase-like lactoylglutathione lyase family enzyme